LTYRGLPLDQLEDLVVRSSSWKKVEATLLPKEEVAGGRPITPLHGGHVGLLCTAGLLNGVFGQDKDRHIARWRTVKSVLCAILNNQPMGFYSAATLVKDAQRHSVHVRPIDVQTSDWQCTIERGEQEKLSVRIGLGYVKSLTKRSAEALVAAREADGPFRSAEDLAQRVPSLSRQELAQLAGVGALNNLDGIEHRRDAIWQVERAGKLEGPLLRQNSDVLRDEEASLPLQQMNTEERLVADYAGTSLTVGKHPMAYRREALRKQNVLSSRDLQNRRHGEFVLIAGCVAARQRPGTANGITFMSLEDEAGLANLIIMVDVYERNRSTVIRSKFILAGGVLQVQDDVIHVKAVWLRPLVDQTLEAQSHDFH
jgi:error-prone DNA polymerase